MRRSPVVAPTPPLIFTSANGQVLSLCARHSTIRDMFLAADLIHADGMPLVFASRLFCQTPLPERVAQRTSFTMSPASRSSAARGFFCLAQPTPSSTRRRSASGRFIPDLELVGHRSGYLAPEEEARVIEDINNAQPDIFGLALAFRGNKISPSAIAIDCAGWD